MSEFGTFRTCGLGQVRSSERKFGKGRDFPLPSAASKSCDVVDPLAKQVSNFQAAGELVILVDVLLFLVL
jgi:hypothetical protein